LFIGKEKGYSSKEKDWLEKAGYYILAGFIVFILLGNISPDLSGMVGAGIYNALLTVKGTFGPVFDLVFFCLFVWLLIKLMKKIDMGPVERSIERRRNEEDKKTGLEKSVAKKQYEKQKELVKDSEKGLNGLKETNILNTLTHIRDTLAKIQYAKIPNVREYVESILKEISSKIDKSLGDRSNFLKVLDDKAKGLTDYFYKKGDIEKKLRDFNGLKEKIRYYALEDVGDSEEKIGRSMEYLTKFSETRKKYLGRLVEIFSKIDDLNKSIKQFIEKIKDSLKKEPIEIDNAVDNVNKAIEIEEQTKPLESETTRLLDGIDKWIETINHIFYVIFPEVNAGLNEKIKEGIVWFADTITEQKKIIKDIVKVHNKFKDKKQKKILHYITNIALNKENIGLERLGEIYKKAEGVYRKIRNVRSQKGGDIEELYNEMRKRYIYVSTSYPKEEIAKLRGLIEQKKIFALKREVEDVISYVNLPIVNFLNACKEFYEKIEKSLIVEKGEELPKQMEFKFFGG